jgi:hypothetical protein
MATNKIRVSPSLNFTEQDLTFTPQRTLTTTTLGLVGESLKGAAFTPTFVETYNEFKGKFGGMNSCKFKNSPMLKYESPYIAKEFSDEPNASMYFTRILGLSGYDAGDAWGLVVKSNLDESTVIETSTANFMAELNYVNGELVSGNFNDVTLQTLFDNKQIDTNIFGGSLVNTGFTYSLSPTYYGSCDSNFVGSRFTGKVYDKHEQTICVTVTTNSTTTQTSGVTQNYCTVQFSAGTVSYNSNLFIDIIDPIIVINNNNNDLTVVPSGKLHIKGGTITHNNDGSITCQSTTITTPNGNILTNGSYKICDLGANHIYYACDGFQGINYHIVTGTTIVNTPTTSTGTTTTTINVPSGLVTVYLSGQTTTLHGTSDASKDNTLVLTLRSKAKYDGNEVLHFDVKNSMLMVESINGEKIKPYDDFKLKGFYTNGTPFEYVVSLDKRKSNFIQKVFSSRNSCCDTDLPLYVEEMYDVMFNKMVSLGEIDCISSSVCHITDLNNYKQSYQGAYTPYIVSELRGNKVKRLFRFKTVGDGNYVNQEAKISIVNIRPDTKTFDIQIRAYHDTDRYPIVLESFSRLTMTKSDNNFIGRKIGDGNMYPSKSNYFTVELDYENCEEDTYPAGYEGYPIKDYGCAKHPKMVYKTKYNLQDKIKNVYLGVSDTVGFDDEWFDYNGQPQTSTIVWTGETKGFHMDKDAQNVYIDGYGSHKLFETGIHSFKNEMELSGTSYEKISARKFTFMAYGGFDGWDIYREARTNSDQWKATGSKSILAFNSGNIDAVSYQDELIGTATNSDYYAYLSAIRTFANPEQVKINLFSVTGINGQEHSDMVEEVIEMIEEERSDAFYVFSMLDSDSEGTVLTADDLAGSIDGLFNTSWAATYAYWGLYNDIENNVFVYLPPTAAVMKAFAYTDRIAKAWYAAGGVSRGATNFKNVRKNPTQNHRDTLYEARINPLWKDGATTYIWGNKTLQGRATVLDNISVRRLLINIRQLFADVAKRLLFEPNDDRVRTQFENMITPILNNIRNERGIFNFKVELDNSSEAIAAGELNGRICIQPIPDVEFINIGFCLTNKSAEFDNL